MLAGKFAQAPGLHGIDEAILLAMTVELFFAQLTLYRLGQSGGLLKVGQLAFPVGFACAAVLTLQPLDVVAITPGLCRDRLAAVALQDLAQQLRITPAVHEDVVVGVDQMAALIIQAYHHHTQQRPMGQVETLGLFGSRQGIQGLVRLDAVTPVEHAERHAQLFVHHLHRVRHRTLPDKTGAQNVVAVDRRLPGITEALRVKTCDIQANLVDVVATRLLVQAVEQHALLHRRQRIDIGDLAGSNWQAVELRLGQARQWEVRWRQACDTGFGAVGNQCRQFLRVVRRQALDGFATETLTAEGPAHTQFPAIHLAIEGQPVAQRRVGALFQAAAFLSRGKQGRVVAIEAAIELAQVVEGDPGAWQRTQVLLYRLIAQVAQGAVTHALVGDGAQLLLDLLDRVALPDRWRQAHREQAGKPTDGAGQVDAVEQLFTTMAFELDQRRGLASPAPDHPGQCGQQQVVDLGSVGRRRLLQQLPGQVLAETGLHGQRQMVLLPPIEALARQVGADIAQAVLPVSQFRLQRRTAGIALQLFAPVLECTGFGRQCQGLAGTHLLIRALQVFQQNPPRYAVHRQVMDHQQQALAAVVEGGQHRPQQRSVLQVETALGPVAQGFQCVGVRYLRLPEQVMVLHAVG
ncbi:hypothetical protein D3C85_228430 [compost metagenome]